MKNGHDKKYVVKYRKSIVKAMKEDKVSLYGFEDSYRRFESSINRMEKEGDAAELLAIEYLNERSLLSTNYRANKVIALGTIKIEADIIDFDNKVVYETKSRKNGEAAKNAIREKWRIFEYDKIGSNYSDYTFVGIVVANYEAGKKVKGLAHFKNSTINQEKMKLSFQSHFDRIEELRKIVPKKKFKPKKKFISGKSYGKNNIIK